MFRNCIYSSLLYFIRDFDTMKSKIKSVAEKCMFCRLRRRKLLQQRIASETESQCSCEGISIDNYLHDNPMHASGAMYEY